MWKKFIRDYFTFTRKERNGLILLSVFMTAVLLWPTVYSWVHKEPPTDFTSFRKQIDPFQNGIKKYPSAEQPDTETASIAELDGATNHEVPTLNTVSLFPFDPNAVSAEEWRKLGIKEKTIETIMNYRKKGGRFYKKEDLKKIYGFRQSDYEKLEPYIHIGNGERKVGEAINKNAASSNASTSPLRPKTGSNYTVELNTADSSLLMTLDGVGSVLSSRIIKFRNKLGGFASTDQLKEIYGLSPEAFEKIKSRVYADSSKIRIININTISSYELKQHPYFRNPIATALISYREEHGPFQKAEDLKNVDVITEELYRKIIPYLKF